MVLPLYKKKVEAMNNLPLPKTVHELRRAIGTFSFYRAHYKNAAEDFSLLTDMLKGHSRKNDKTRLKWTTASELAFNTCKEKLANAALLAYPVPSAELSLTTDASNVAIGASLNQHLSNGVIQPLGFFS